MVLSSLRLVAGALLIPMLLGQLVVPLAAQQPVIEQAKRLVLMLESRAGEHSFKGAGILIGARERGADYVIATARHNIRKGGAPVDEVLVYSLDDPKKALTAKILPFEDEASDLGFLTIDRLPTSSEALPWNRLAATAGLKRSDRLFTVGNHGGGSWEFNSQPDRFANWNEDPHRHEFKYDSTLVNHGASGGGVFDGNWKLVGMALGAEPQMARGRATSLDWILQFAKENGVIFVEGLGVIDSPMPLPVPPLPTPELVSEVASESEPRGAAGESKPSGIACGEVARGEIAANAVSPVSFAVVAPSNGYMYVEVQNMAAPKTPKAVLQGVTLTDAYGVALETIPSRRLSVGGAASSTYPVAVRSGQLYLIHVEPAPSMARIEFTVAPSFVPVEFTDAYEPNDAASDAYEIGIGVEVRTRIGFGKDRRDWYRVRPQASGILHVTVQNLAPNHAKPSNMAAVTIFDESEMVERGVITARFLKPGSPAKSTSPLTVEAGRTYVISIEGEDQFHASPYMLSTSLSPYRVTDTGEPNDLAGSEFDLTPGAMCDALVGIGDDVRDCYAITAARSGVLSIEITNENPKHTLFGGLKAVRILDETGATIEAIPERFLPPGAPPKSKQVSVEKGKRYTVQIEPVATGHVVRYVLRTSFQE